MTGVWEMCYSNKRHMPYLANKQTTVHSKNDGLL